MQCADCGETAALREIGAPHDILHAQGGRRRAASMGECRALRTSCGDMSRHTTPARRSRTMDWRGGVSPAGRGRRLRTRCLRGGRAAAALDLPTPLAELGQSPRMYGLVVPDHEHVGRADQALELRLSLVRPPRGRALDALPGAELPGQGSASPHRRVRRGSSGHAREIRASSANLGAAVRCGRAPRPPEFAFQCGADPRSTPARTRLRAIARDVPT